MFGPMNEGRGFATISYLAGLQSAPPNLPINATTSSSVIRPDMVHEWRFASCRFVGGSEAEEEAAKQRRRQMDPHPVAASRQDLSSAKLAKIKLRN